MNLFKKKITIPTTDKEEVEAYESWAVRYTSLHGSYISADTKQECEFFTAKEDAKKFKQQLQDAYKLTKRTAFTDIKIEQS